MDELSLFDYLSILKRWKKLFFLTVLAVVCLSVLFALRWSNYRATATIEAEQPEIPVSVTTPMGMNPNDMSQVQADTRISHIQQKVLSTGSLVDIITKFNLYAGARDHAPIADIADKMRSKIRLGPVNSALGGGSSKASSGQNSPVAFTLGFDYNDPLVAQQVTNELVTRFLDEDLKDRRSQARETSALLASQIAALEATMAEQEKKIADFRAAHGDMRPEALLFNQQGAASTALSIQNIDSQITTNEGTQGALRAQLALVDPYSRIVADGQVLTTPRVQLKALQSQFTTLSAQYGPDHPDVIKTRNQIEALKAQVGDSKETADIKAKITDVRTNLAAARKTYGPENPDVLSLQNQLKNLERQLEEQSKNPAADHALKQDADNPAYLQLVAQLNTAEEQHNSLLAQKETLLAQQEKYQQAVAANPAAEQQMATLTRDYDNVQLRYRELKEKMMAAGMNEQMELDRKGQRLAVINPPELPLGTQPSRRLIVLGGLVLSLMAGFFSVGTAQILSQSIVSPRHLASLTGAAPLVAVPHIFTKEEISNKGRNKFRLAIIAIALFVAVVMAFSMAVMPLDVFWSVISRRLGFS
jgi:polysaccharide biosynthesis transport protein